MILIDFHQTMIANIMKMIYSDTIVEINEDLLRHNILNSILRLRKKFKAEYGNIIICCDSKLSWRKEIFPYYKANRKKMKENSDIDWNFIYNFMNEIKDEIKKYLPFIIVEVKKAEGDDVIGVLDEYILSESINSKNLIISRDKDFDQLLSEYTSIFNPVKNKITSKNIWFLEDYDEKAKNIIRHILSGDIIDGIPNVLSDDDTFVSEIKRQKPLKKLKLEKYIEEIFNNNFDNIDIKNYNRNKSLINLSYIPSEIRLNIINEYEKEKEIKESYDSNNLINYFIEKRLNNMMENIQEFFI